MKSQFCLHTLKNTLQTQNALHFSSPPCNNCSYLKANRKTMKQGLVFVFHDNQVLHLQEVFLFMKLVITCGHTHHLPSFEMKH